MCKREERERDCKEASVSMCKREEREIEIDREREVERETAKK